MENFRRFQDVIARVAFVHPDQIKFEDSLSEDLDIFPEMFNDITIELNEEFNINIDSLKLNNVQTIKDLYDIVQNEVHHIDSKSQVTVDSVKPDKSKIEITINCLKTSRQMLQDISLGKQDNYTSFSMDQIKQFIEDTDLQILEYSKLLH